MIAQNLSTRQSSAAVCPVCFSNQTNHVLTIESAPVICNVLCDSPAEARAIQTANIILTVCTSCGHLFNQAFDPTLIDYGGPYENALHHSPRFSAFAAEIAARIVRTYGIRRKRVLEVGCGDGDFLRLLCEAGHNTGVGFDPSISPATIALAAENGLELVRDFYNEKYHTHRGDCIVCRHVIEHLNRPVDFLRMVHATAAAGDHTIFYFEAPNALFTLEHGGVWDILYEHYSYFTPSSLAEAFLRSGLAPRAIYEEFGRMYVCIEADKMHDRSRRPPYHDCTPAHATNHAATLAQTYDHKRAYWRRRLAEIRDAGKKAVLWGAGTKGVMFLNTLKPDCISYAVDLNPKKQGRYIAGTGQRIVAPQALTAIRPDYLVALNPLYAEEIATMAHDMGVKARILNDTNP